MAEIKFSYNDEYNKNTLKDCNQKTNSHQIFKKISINLSPQRKVDGGNGGNT